MARSHTRAWKQHHNPVQKQWLTQQNTGRTLSTETNMYKPKQTATQQTGGGRQKITSPEGVQCRSHSKQGGSKPAIDQRTCMGKGKKQYHQSMAKTTPPAPPGSLFTCPPTTRKAMHNEPSRAAVHVDWSPRKANTHVYTMNKPVMRWMQWPNKQTKTPKGQMLQRRTVRQTSCYPSIWQENKDNMPAKQEGVKAVNKTENAITITWHTPRAQHS